MAQLGLGLCAILRLCDDRSVLAGVQSNNTVLVDAARRSIALSATCERAHMEFDFMGRSLLWRMTASHPHLAVAAGC